MDTGPASSPLEPTAVEVDRALADLAARVDLLLDVTPTNGEEAWSLSQRAAHRSDLVLRYRSVGTDVDAVRQDLEGVAVETVEDPVVRALLGAKAEELGLQLRLIEARGTPSFLGLSVALWGTADDALVAVALTLLDRVAPSPPPLELVTPAEFAVRAQREVDRYREQDPDLRATVAVRDDVPSLMVVQRELIVGTDSWIPSHRADALVHHEVGTHLLTAATGGRQPLSLLEHGLARYEETQEALGVLAEHLVDGIDGDRLRTLAGRAVAARRLSDGAGFADIHHELHRTHGFSERAAWAIAMRIVRGGGLTKDVIYLRGVAALVGHLAAGGDLARLLVGKLHLSQVPQVESLLDRGVLKPAHLRPRWLDGDGPTARLEALRTGRVSLADWP